METEELRDKIHDFVYSKKALFLLIVLVLIIIIVLFIPKENKLEKEIINYTKVYIQKNNINSNTFVSLYQLEEAGIYKSSGCNQATGIYYYQGKYVPYLMCNEYYSSTITDLKNSNKYLALNGNVFLITNSSNFQDPGYTLKNQNYKVEVINTFKPTHGLYKISYIIRDQSGSRKGILERIVLYSEYNENYNSESLRLKGSNPTYVLKDKQYVEPGFIAVDKNGNDQTSLVKVSGSVNTSVPGSYTLTYKLNQIEVTRTVIVSNIAAVLNVDEEEEYVSDSVNIMIKIMGQDYSHTILPDGQRSLNTSINFEVVNNGVYSFIVYDKYNNQIKLDKKIMNIDKSIPQGTCVANLNEGKTYITVTATDELSGIAGYYYSNGSNTTSLINNNQYTYSNLYDNISVIIEDKVGNKANITCTKTGDGSYAQIKPASGANIIKSDSSDSLKVSIEKTSGYYLTRVWVRDPYNQTQKGVIANWGSQLERPFNIIQREISNKNLQNKIVVAINASGFYLAGSWEPNSSSYNSQYNKTTEGPLVITNGQVVRNWYYDSAIDKARNHALYAISPSGNLEVYPNFNKLSENERKNLFTKIINSNYKNSWVFRPVIMQNGQIVSSDILGTFLNGGGKRQVVCQINRNNFAIISSTSNYNINGLRTILSNLKCQTAVNMDGGGSVALLYKSKNGALESITGGSRAIADTLYFTEK